MLKVIIQCLVLSITGLLLTGCGNGSAARGTFTGQVISRLVKTKEGKQVRALGFIIQTAPNGSTWTQKDTGFSTGMGSPTFLAADSNGNLYPLNTDMMGKNLKIEGVLKSIAPRLDDKEVEWLDKPDNLVSGLQVKKWEILEGGFDGLAARGTFTGRLVPRTMKTEHGDTFQTCELIIFTAPNWSTEKYKDLGSRPGNIAFLAKGPEGNTFNISADMFGKNVRIDGVLKLMSQHLDGQSVSSADRIPDAKFGIQVNKMEFIEAGESSAKK